MKIAIAAMMIALFAGANASACNKDQYGNPLTNIEDTKTVAWLSSSARTPAPPATSKVQTANVSPAGR
jgi:hypothetical protein